MQQGVSRAIGVDSSAAMLQYAKRLAAEASAGVELVRGSLGSLSKTLQMGMHRSKTDEAAYALDLPFRICLQVEPVPKLSAGLQRHWTLVWARKEMVMML